MIFEVGAIWGIWNGTAQDAGFEWVTSDRERAFNLATEMYIYSVYLAALFCVTVSITAVNVYILIKNCESMSKPGLNAWPIQRQLPPLLD